MFKGFYTRSQYQYGNWVKIQLTVSKGHFLNLDPGSGQVWCDILSIMLKKSLKERQVRELKRELKIELNRELK